MIRIPGGPRIDPSEFRFDATTSQGPGGQHVNRSQTRVVLLWDVDASPSLDEGARRRIHAKLATRINREGVLQVASQKHRSQARNRDATIERLIELLTAAFERPKPRRATKPTRASQRRRVDDKKKRGQIKKARKRPGPVDD